MPSPLRHCFALFAVFFLSILSSNAWGQQQDGAQPAERLSSLMEGFRIGAFGTASGGDANGDGAVNVADVFWMLNYLFASGPAPAAFNAMSWRGPWNSATTYGVQDVVSYNGSSYVSLTASNTNNPPDTSPGSWNVLAERANFTGTTAGGDLSGTYPNPSVSSVGGATAANVATATAAANSAVSANTANTIVRRDGAGGFAAGALTLSGRLDQTSVDGLVAKGTVNVGTIPATGGGTRLMWYPGKSAFRVGSVSGMHWEDANVGSQSTPTGTTPPPSGVGLYSTAMGLDTVASGFSSTAIGDNTTASGNYSTAMGNFTFAGPYSTAMGYRTTASGFFSTAMGHQTIASSNHSTAMGSYAWTDFYIGTFVWGDASSTLHVRPAADNQFVARAAGGVIFYSNAAGSTGVGLAPGAASWASLSDRESKADFLPIDAEQILGRMAELPLTSWRYKDDPAERRYIGPVAQDFYALFGLGNQTTLATLDVDGVTLAAVQALEQRTAELKAENATVRDQLEKLLLRIEQLEAPSRAVD